MSHEGGKRTDTLCFCERLACALCGEVGGSFITQQVSFLSSRQIDYQILLVLLMMHFFYVIYGKSTALYGFLKSTSSS